MTKLVTIAIPVYRQLNFLPQTLKSVDSQDYPHIELIISDNGMNGEKIPEIVNQYYSRSYKFRQNHTSVPVIEHFNQLVNEASGDYFVLLSDDDEISYNYVSELVSLLEENPQAVVGISRYEIISEFGQTIQSSYEQRSDIISGEEFLLALCRREYKNGSTQTHLSRTQHIRACGGFPDFPRGIHSDDALLIKLCLNNYVALGQNCTFRWRVSELSTGSTKTYQESAVACRQFLKFLDSDPQLVDYASKHSGKWARIRRHFIRAGTGVHLAMWKDAYRKNINFLEWMQAAFTMPFIPSYYAKVVYNLLKIIKVTALVPQGIEVRLKKYLS